MEKGLILALFSALAFAGSIVYIRKAGAQTGESFTGVAFSVFFGVPFFAVSVSLSGDWNKLWSVSGQGFMLLGIAGIIHFIAGRLLSYNSYRLIGANKASALLRTVPFYTLILGVIFLNESLTTWLILGVVCIFAGAVSVSAERKSVSGEGQTRFSKTEVKGILAALGGALFWGISPVLIKPAVMEVGSPSISAFISYVTASIIMAFFLFRRQHRQQITRLRISTSLTPLLIGGIFVSVAQLLRYMALIHSPASMVTPIGSTSTFFVFIFSFLINRNIEVFTRKVTLGMGVMVAGTFLIFY